MRVNTTEVSLSVQLYAKFRFGKRTSSKFISQYPFRAYFTVFTSDIG